MGLEASQNSAEVKDYVECENLWQGCLSIGAPCHEKFPSESTRWERSRFRAGAEIRPAQLFRLVGQGSTGRAGRTTGAGRDIIHNNRQDG